MSSKSWVLHGAKNLRQVTCVHGVRVKYRGFADGRGTLVGRSRLKIRMHRMVAVAVESCVRRSQNIELNRALDRQGSAGLSECPWLAEVLVDQTDENEVILIVRELSPNKSAGHDDIFPKSCQGYYQ